MVNLFYVHNVQKKSLSMSQRTQCTAPTILTDFFNKYLVNIRGRVRSVRGVSGLWSG